MEENIFFLLYHGNGYTDEALRKWPLERFRWHVQKLLNQKNAEREAQEKATKHAAKQSAKRSRRR